MILFFVFCAICQDFPQHYYEHGKNIRHLIRDHLRDLVHLRNLKT